MKAPGIDEESTAEGSSSSESGSTSPKSDEGCSHSAPSRSQVPLKPEAAEALPDFHEANIHERRLAATVARAFPLGLYVKVVVVLALGVLRYEQLLLRVTLFLSATMWVWFCSTAMVGIYVGISRTRHSLAEAQQSGSKGSWWQLRGSSGAQEVPEATPEAPEARIPVHLVVVPNYREDEELLAQTLESLSEADGSNNFQVVLAMEAREGAAAEDKGRRLQERFKERFTRILVSMHPEGRSQRHQDGTVVVEVPGKASNLRWAVRWAAQELKRKEHLDFTNVLVTVQDADCLFHPAYFSHVQTEYMALRQGGDAKHLWTMWQAPQLPFRNYFETHFVSRVWAYVASLYEFGGVSWLALANWGGHHMLFSAYTLPLRLALDANAWDGDVIAEDHHCFMKCFFFWLRQAAAAGAATAAAESQQGECEDGTATMAPTSEKHRCVAGGRAPSPPHLAIRPVFLPVKATSVMSPEGWRHSWVERWRQAKRHAQGVAELSYGLLATFDFLRAAWRRKGACNPRLMLRVLQVVFYPLLLHIVPIVQTTAAAALVVRCLLHDERPSLVFHSLQGWFQEPRSHLASLEWSAQAMALAGSQHVMLLLFCSLLPPLLLLLANFLFIWTAFVQPSQRQAAATGRRMIWNAEDAMVPRQDGWKYNYRRLAALLIFDISFWLWPLMLPFGVAVEIIAYWNVCFSGNHVEYISAAKSLGSGYGSLASGGEGKLSSEGVAPSGAGVSKELG